MLNKFIAKPLALAVGLALAAPAMAVDWSMKESNIYMKFLAGDRLGEANSPKEGGAGGNSGDTASGADQGQWSELNLQVRATVNSKVEAGFRVQSRSSASYWSEFGFKDEDNPDKTMNSRKYMKLRGAYMQLSPGYGWLNEVRIGSNQWSMFDPFTVGAMRYIDRDNINGFYFKGKAGLATWEAARITMPEYLGFNWGNAPTCCGNDDVQKNEATYIGQVRMPVGGAKLTFSAQSYSDRVSNPTDTNVLNGKDLLTIFKNNVYALKAEGSPVDGVDLKGAYYRSSSDVADKYNGVALIGESWSVTPRKSISDNALKFDAAFNALPIANLSLAYQYFNIGEGYFSIAAARRESDVLLTEGSESAWYNWGNNNWLGGSASDSFHQGAHRGADNDFIDFNESPVESVLGWKGHTLVANYEVADTPMLVEMTRVGYNNNWQNYNATGPLSGWYAQNQDRKTNIAVFKASHVFRIGGGLDTSFKYKHVKDTDGRNTALATDNTETKDSGYSFTVGKQLHNDLYGSLSYGRYNRDITDSGKAYDNEKGILSAKFTYSLGGFEFGTLAQWIDGKGDPNRTGVRTDVSQYRLKATAQTTF
jgi:hypothetical protein